MKIITPNNLRWTRDDKEISTLYLAWYFTLKEDNFDFC